jgi:hypothetical protein
MVEALGRRAPIELTADRDMSRRVRRLGFVSLFALGLIWALAVTTLRTPWVVGAALAGGWVLMPTILFASLTRPRLRYGLVVPATLVGGGLLAILIWWLPTSTIAVAGWVMMAAGIALGGVLGLWFWYRWLPVPDALDNPYSRGRWAFISLHVALIVTGWLLAATLLFGG